MMVSQEPAGHLNGSVALTLEADVLHFLVTVSVAERFDQRTARGRDPLRRLVLGYGLVSAAAGADASGAFRIGQRDL